MRRSIVVAFLCAFTFSCATSSPRVQPPTLVLLNGKVFTSDPKQPWVEAIAIRGDRIVAIGTTNDIRVLQGPDTEIVNVHGRTIVPGINDAHVHAPWASSSTDLDLAPTATFDDLLNALRKTAASAPRGTWISASLPLPLLDETRLTRAALDVAASDHPVRLGNMAGHAYLLNSAALRAWNIGDTDPDPPAGWYGRADGRLNGWLYEHAAWSKMAADAARQSDDQLAQSMERFAQQATSFGITSVQSMPLVSAERLSALASRSTLPLRWRWIDFQLGTVNENPTRAVKYILDGTPIERGAAVREPYSDQPAVRGRVNYTDEQLRRIVQIAATSSQQLLLHISGEVALQKLISLMREIPADWPSKRVRVEHGEFIGDYAEAVKELGIVLVQNPAHFMIPEVTRVRFGEERSPKLQALRSMSARNIPVALGSDGPINPWLNVMFAALHPTNPGEAVTREWAVTAYTAGSAFAEFAEEEKGTIAPGKLADLAVLSQDVFTVPLEALPKTTAVMTVIGGNVVHRQP